MISREIKYTDYDGNAVTQTYWFHLTKVEVAELALHDAFEDIMASKDSVRAVKALKRIIRGAVVQRVGDKVRKPEGYGDEFVASDAYSEFVLDLLSDPDTAEQKMRDFVSGVAPWAVAEGVKKGK